MQGSVASPPPSSTAESDRRAPILSVLAPRSLLTAASLGILWFTLCKYLSSEWSLNEQYSYGWFVPFFAAYLFWLRWEDRPAADGYLLSVVGSPNNHSRLADNGAAAAAALALLLLLPLRLFEVGNPDWRPLGWVHAAIVVALTLGLLWHMGGTRWVKHFAFPVCFILVAVPWVSAVEMPIIQGLMRWVASVSAETLNLFGVPAQLEGNLIRVSTGLVGVNEACSGVRSLQTSIMIGLLFGELKRLSVVRRLILLGAALAIALVANCARALFLVTLAARDSGGVERWHDAAGYSILAAVFIGTMGVAALLARTTKAQTSQIRDQERLDARASDVRPLNSSPFRLSTSYFLLCLAWLLCVEAGVELWYGAHERQLIPEKSWSVQFPEQAAGFRELEIEEGVRRTLRFDDGREATWIIQAGAPVAGPDKALRTYAFFFRWNPKGSSVVRARAHRPDVCLPSAGWSMMEDRGTAEYRVGDIRVPFRRNVFGREGASAVAYTFFCLQEDRRRPNEERPDLLVTGGAQPDWSLAGRTRVVRNGVRNLGQQVLEVILVAPAPLDYAAVEEEFSKVLQTLVTPEAAGARS